MAERVSWMRQDTPENVKQMLNAGAIAEEMKQNKGKYKILADLFKKGSADITGDSKIFALLNRPTHLEDDEKLTLEQYMKFFPQEVEDAMWIADKRRSENSKAYNSNSKAKWHHWGEMPVSIGHLLHEMYPDKEDFKDACRRFFNKFPKFRISIGRI